MAVTERDQDFDTELVTMAYCQKKVAEAKDLAVRMARLYLGNKTEPLRAIALRLLDKR